MVTVSLAMWRQTFVFDVNSSVTHLFPQVDTVMSSLLHQRNINSVSCRENCSDRQLLPWTASSATSLQAAIIRKQCIMGKGKERAIHFRCKLGFISFIGEGR